MFLIAKQVIQSHCEHGSEHGNGHEQSKFYKNNVSCYFFPQFMSNVLGLTRVVPDALKTPFSSQ